MEKDKQCKDIKLINLMILLVTKNCSPPTQSGTLPERVPSQGALKRVTHYNRVIFAMPER